MVIVGAMKCGTTSLHHYLDLHPDVAMSRPKELNFFFGPDEGPDGDWSRGNWHRGVDWYAAHFDPAATVRGEASPGYTSPAHPEVAGRMAAVVPGARLVCAVRDPISRAVSQYRHHRREGTESRELAEALLDPESQYVSRGRYAERLAPFLADFGDALTIVVQEELDAAPRPVLRRLFAGLRIDEDFWTPAMGERRNTSDDAPPDLPDVLRGELAELLRDDAERLRELAGRDFPGWTV